MFQAKMSKRIIAPGNIDSPGCHRLWIIGFPVEREEILCVSVRSEAVANPAANLATIASRTGYTDDVL